MCNNFFLSKLYKMNSLKVHIKTFHVKVYINTTFMLMWFKYIINTSIKNVFKLRYQNMFFIYVHKIERFKFHEVNFMKTLSGSHGYLDYFRMFIFIFKYVPHIKCWSNVLTCQHSNMRICFVMWWGWKSYNLV